jgi:hypothetical protein
MRLFHISANRDCLVVTDWERKAQAEATLRKGVQLTTLILIWLRT